MKKNLFTALSGLTFGLLMIGCQNEEVASPKLNGTITPRTICGLVDYNAPTEVNVDEEFTITAAVPCGRIAIDRAYVLAADMVTRIYVGLTCNTSGLLWEEGQFECASVDESTNYTLGAAGTYVFRTRHNANSGGPCGGSANNCSSFNGNAMCCFEVLAVDPCANEITAEVSCDEDETCNRSVTFTFTAEEDGPVVVQGGLTAHTTICEASATGGLVRNLTHSSVTNSNANVTRWEGTVVGCEEYSVTISWTSTNIGEKITGDWTVKQVIDEDEVEIASICSLNCEGAEICD